MHRDLVVSAFVASLALFGCGRGDRTPVAASAAPPRAAAPAASPQPSSEPRYEATLADGIQFDKPGYPSFIRAAKGMSTYEKGHRWTEGPAVTFVFTQPLPASFVLRLEVNGAFGPNAGKPLKVSVGDWSGEAVIGEGAQTVELRVQTGAPADAVAMAIAQPTSPKEIGMSADPRKLGVDFRRISFSTP